MRTSWIPPLLVNKPWNISAFIIITFKFNLCETFEIYYIVSNLLNGHVLIKNWKIWTSVYVAVNKCCMNSQTANKYRITIFGRDTVTVNYSNVGVGGILCLNSSNIFFIAFWGLNTVSTSTDLNNLAIFSEISL